MIKSASTLPVSTNVSSSSAHTTKTLDSRLSHGHDAKSIDGSSNYSSTPPHSSSSISTNSSISNSISPQKLHTQTSATSSAFTSSSCTSATSTTNAQNTFKGWYIQPACAITGDGLQEGLEALYEMVMKKRKLNKAHKKKRH